MEDKSRRRELAAQYKQMPVEAGVFRIVNTATGRVLLGSTLNLPSLHSKLTFARSSNVPGALDLRLKPDILRYGIEVFTLEVLETVLPEPGATEAQTRSDLATLEALWREKQDPALLY